ncbi:hypothetical protein QUB68_00275 [Microcoleus sp. A006_D1]|uniref:hypothetical protein n=1 Tax=Microcoleus sp. A006_D1 TaxID=3055267 RepID=UPI002FCFF624
MIEKEEGRRKKEEGRRKKEEDKKIRRRFQPPVFQPAEAGFVCVDAVSTAESNLAHYIYAILRKCDRLKD